MREIKFRGFTKEKETNEWIKGSYIYRSCESPVPEFGGVYEEHLIGHYGFNDLYTEGIDFTSLGQYTGLQDKYGYDIYEGDIVRICDNKNGSLKVEFKNQYVGGWVLTYPMLPDLSLGARKQEDLEVVGNFYENPELWK